MQYIKKLLCVLGQEVLKALKNIGKIILEVIVGLLAGVALTVAVMCVLTGVGFLLTLVQPDVKIPGSGIDYYSTLCALGGVITVSFVTLGQIVLQLIKVYRWVKQEVTCIRDRVRAFELKEKAMPFEQIDHSDIEAIEEEGARDLHKD